MSITHKISTRLHEPLQTFRLFEIIIAIVCIAMPAFLRWGDTGNTVFRFCISDYVNMTHNYLFGMLLCIAAMLFIFNGAVYFKNRRHLNLSEAGQWYNIVLGISLLIVILLPYDVYPVPHYIFAGTFFIGNAIVIGIFHKKKYRALSITLAVLTIVTISLPFWTKTISIFTAEWLSLTVIGIHLILEAKGAISITPASQPAQTANHPQRRPVYNVET